MSGLKSRLKRNKFFIATVMLLRTIVKNNTFQVKKGNTVKIDGLMSGARICVNGQENSITVKNPKTNAGLRIFVNGNKNRVTIEENCVLKNLDIWIEDDNNQIIIEKDTLICGETKLSCIEGSKIHIGEGSMFSSAIDVRTGDSHSILNKEGRRINPSADVCIGKHVWIGYGVTLLKGVSVAENSILGTRAVVTKSFDEAGIVLVGNPARKVKENINWDYQRIPVDGTIGVYHFDD